MTDAYPAITPDTSQPPLGPRSELMRSEAAKIYREYPIAQFVSDEWTVPTIKEVLREHEQGNFFRSAFLADAMGRDDRIESALETIILGILRLPFRVVRALLDDAEADDVFKLVAALWAAGVFSETELYDFVRSFLMLGVGLLELIWDTSDPLQWKIKGVKTWHLSFVYWREDLRVYILQTADGPVQIDPGNGKWVLLTRGQRGWMRGAVRSLPIWWLIRVFVTRDWAHHSEVLGQGVLKAKTPSGAPDPDRNRFIQSLRTLGSDGLLECPVDSDGNGYDAEILEAEFDHGDGFEKLLCRCDKNIETRLLGQSATTENSGPYVARGVFKSVTLDRIDGTVGPLESVLQEQAFRPLAVFNTGRADVAPSADWDSEPPPDKLTQAQAMMNLGQFISAAHVAGYDVDPIEIKQRFGVTLKKSATPPAPAAAPPAPPK